MDTLLPLLALPQVKAVRCTRTAPKGLRKEKDRSLDNKQGTGFGGTGVDPPLDITYTLTEVRGREVSKRRRFGRSRGRD